MPERQSEPTPDDSAPRPWSPFSSSRAPEPSHPGQLPLPMEEPPTPWQTGGTPDTSRIPGTRRLWLAGALALATVVACVTALTTTDHAADASAAQNADTKLDSADPGLLTFASPSAGPSVYPGAKSGRSSERAAQTTPDGSTSAEPTQHGSASKPAAERSKPASSTGTSSGSKPSAAWKSVRSVNYPDRYWHLGGDIGRLDPVSSGSSATTRQDATFKLVKGLADTSCYSFATTDGTYLRHSRFRLRADRNDGTALFKKDATFCPRTSSYSGAVMLESVNYPGRYLRHKDFLLRLDPYDNTGQYRADSAFRLVKGWD
ncbi:AbfB domain-containing protein [Streptomyces avermitilis]|uniref:AbfB domain-containing protein n=1 Tax=Streptomyces avermitilis TaxID=33903 RepID=UPI0033DC63CA